MRKIAFFTCLLSLLMVSRFAYSQDDSAAAVKPTEQNLVDLERTRSEDQVRDLERRIDELEREIRFQDDRVRNLERTVNDLRRGR